MAIVEGFISECSKGSSTGWLGAVDTGPVAGLLSTAPWLSAKLGVNPEVWS